MKKTTKAVRSRGFARLSPTSHDQLHTNSRTSPHITMTYRSVFALTSPTNIVVNETKQGATTMVQIEFASLSKYTGPEARNRLLPLALCSSRRTPQSANAATTTAGIYRKRVSIYLSDDRLSVYLL